MTMMTKNDKSGRLTDSRWWFCEIDQHDKCAVEIELSSRFEGCPCECHQTARQPTPPTPAGGEWRVDSVDACMVVDLTSKNIADAWTPELATQIVADHHAVPRLVEALQEILRSGVEFDDSRIGYVVMQVNREAIKDANSAIILATTTPPDAGEGRER